MVGCAAFAQDQNLERVALSARDSARSPPGPKPIIERGSFAGANVEAEPKGGTATTTSSIGPCHVIRLFSVPINDTFLQGPTNKPTRAIYPRTSVL
jgi:hypothetical protein